MAASERQKEEMRNFRAKYLQMRQEGAKTISASHAEPPAAAGVFAKGFEKWTPGKTYAKNEVFRYGEHVGFARQEGIVASEVYPPFSAGTEALYGVRPAPDAEGVYPYVYNMRVENGMRVRENGAVYICIAPAGADPLLYQPSAVPALFAREE